MTDSERPWPAPATNAGADTDWWRGSITDAEPVDEVGPAPADAHGADAGDVEVGELVDGEPPAGARPAPRPFAGPPRPVPRVPALPLPPERPAAPAPMLPPVPVPVPVPGVPGPATARPGLPTQRGGPLARPRRPARTPRGTRRPAQPSRPWLAVPALVLLALAAAFFGWVTAEPVWLAVGHSHTGTARVIAGSDGCRATFVADGGAFTAPTVELSGVDAQACAAGATVSARMVSAESDRAYVADRRGLALRIGIGYGLVLLCGLLIAWVTGALRARGWRRAASWGLSLLGPALLAAGMLAATY